jgi:hypothetical protein
VIPSLSSGAEQIERSPTLACLILVATSINLSPLTTYNGRAWLTLANGLSRYSALFAAIYKILPDNQSPGEILTSAAATAPLSRQGSL